MNITHESLEDKKQALISQREQGLALYQQSCGAIQLIEALQAELQDALTENQLAGMIENGNTDH